MRLKYLFTTATTLMMLCSAKAQEINNSLSYKNINAESYFRLNYENDFFSATDQYYTQGIHLEVVSPAMKKFFLSKLLVHPKWNYIKYGVGLEHDAYTPTSIGSDSILHGDRPFAACLFLKTSLIAIDPENKQRFSASLSTGVIGPAAGGKEMQTDIHRWLNNVTPHGWQYQIQNDAIVNYEVDYEKQLMTIDKYLLIDAEGMIRAGTLSDKAGIGSTLMFGYFDSPYSKEITSGKAFRMYAYEHPEIAVIGYDATLEGGLFDRTSPYTLKSGDLNRFVFQNRFGFVVVVRRINLEYFQSVKSNEFNTGKMHVWGGVQVAVGL